MTEVPGQIRTPGYVECLPDRGHYAADRARGFMRDMIGARDNVWWRSALAGKVSGYAAAQCLPIIAHRQDIALEQANDNASGRAHEEF